MCQVGNAANVLFNFGVMILQESDITHFVQGERLQTVTFKRAEDFKKHSSLLTNAVREGFKALGTDLAGELMSNVAKFCLDVI